MTAQGRKAGTSCTRLLADTQAAPVIAGLAAGIVLVALFGSLFSSTAPLVQQRLHTDLSIEDLKGVYSVGEIIHFTVRATGYGPVCGYPFLKVIDLDRGGSVIFSSADRFLSVCDQSPRGFDELWKSSELGAANPMSINRVGHYKLVVNFGNVEEEEYFIVDNTVNRAIDKAKDRGEVVEFLSYYPGANVTVYFITTCATESCETLIRIPATVEYWYENIGDVTELALLRIGLEHRFDGEPNFVQASCSIRGTEVANEIHGTTIEQGRITEFLQGEEWCPQRPDA